MQLWIAILKTIMVISPSPPMMQLLAPYCRCTYECASNSLLLAVLSHLSRHLFISGYFCYPAFGVITKSYMYSSSQSGKSYRQPNAMFTSTAGSFESLGDSDIAGVIYTTTPPMMESNDFQQGALQANPYWYAELTHGDTYDYASIRSTNPTLTELPPPLPLRQLSQQPTAETSATNRQDQAISDFLGRGTCSACIPGYVENFKTMERLGNFHDLAIIAEIPMEELSQRIEDVGQRIIINTMYCANTRQ
jgi:hypothetical protein